MENGAMAPQGGQDGAGAVQGMMEGIMKQAEVLTAAGEQLTQMGAPGAEEIMQAAKLLTAGIEKLGGGGVSPAMGQNPDTAGAPSARPADMRG